jgi:hypothetical protein
MVICCDVLSKRWRLMDDWRKQDWCVDNGLFKESWSSSLCQMSNSMM